MEFLLIIIATAIIVAVPMFFVSELMKKDNEIAMWQKAYTEITIENELMKLGVMK